MPFVVNELTFEKSIGNLTESWLPEKPIMHRRLELSIPPRDFWRTENSPEVESVTHSQFNQPCLSNEAQETTWV